MERRPRNKKGEVLANAVVRIYAFIVTAHNTARLNKTPMVMITQDRRERARATNKRGPTVGRKGTGGGRARGCSRLIHKTTGSAAQRLSGSATGPAVLTGILVMPNRRHRPLPSPSRPPLPTLRLRGSPCLRCDSVTGVPGRGEDGGPSPCWGAPTPHLCALLHSFKQLFKLCC